MSSVWILPNIKQSNNANTPKSFQYREAEGTLHNILFYEANIIIISNPDTDFSTKEKLLTCERM